MGNTLINPLHYYNHLFLSSRDISDCNRPCKFGGIGSAVAVKSACGFLQFRASSAAGRQSGIIIYLFWASGRIDPARPGVRGIGHYIGIPYIPHQLHPFLRQIYGGKPGVDVCNIAQKIRHYSVYRG